MTLKKLAAEAQISEAGTILSILRRLQKYNQSALSRMLGRVVSTNRGPHEELA